MTTGPFQRPKVPEAAAHLSPDVRQLHSSEYRSPFDLPVLDDAGRPRHRRGVVADAP